jgi:hypothetical protein
VFQISSTDTDWVKRSWLTNIYAHCWAEETIFFQEDGKVKQRVNVASLRIRHSSLRTAFELHKSYAPRDTKEAAQFGIKVVVVDIPRPPRKAIDVTPPVTGGNGKPPTDNNGHDWRYITFPQVIPEGLEL